ncbi:RNA ligase [Virgisporangium aliadipatigenens]|uniref:RNA ligase n=1 Tax=Virgisporangium aliadipatigenens TaxID=741659 RepID=A0A8J3YWA1_9ACTN|nr:RNA ligase (ATP) [Virgisporangium aliadipatigenens]GIJ51857.1 RNA ligase [Virgisporangium aliadipatigenens]
MSTLTVTAERLVIHEHTNADALELAQVGLYRAVVAKGAYRTGEYAIYVPEGSVLPAALIEELGLTGMLAGKDHDRVKAVRLRGEISQGIVCRPSAVRDLDLERHHDERTNFADLLGITKWVPEIPAHMSGEMVSAPGLLPWLEVENIRRYPTLFTPGEPVVATEKIHGTACLTTVLADGSTFVTSKGFGHQRLGIVESPRNLYWRAVRAHRVAEFALDLLRRHGAARVGVFGEVYGQGVQDLGYKVNAGVEPGFAAFDIALDLPDRGIVWLDPAALVEAAGDALPLVPTLYEGPYDEEALIALADGSTVLGGGAHIREGVVIRPATDRWSEVTAGRAIGKFVSPKYLTRKGGTEFE